MPAQTDVEHLLRRTEFAARPSRVAELMAKSTLEECVDDILAVPADPGSVGFTQTANWQMGEELTHFWFDRMAHDSPRPIQEKMGFFWHGHFCSDMKKAGSAALMREQIDLFRSRALGNFRDLAVSMSTQVAMLRYLDNNRNKKSSPNQNFARELMELFVLGVGNYTETDVEASTAAWTGHSDDWQTGAYVWKDDWHDVNAKTFLGRTINTDSSSVAARQLHGRETIEVMLGTGVVPAGASVVANRGRPTREVAAEFVSRKLWTAFAGTTPPGAVVAAMRDAAIANDFELKPWLRTMLTRNEFYAADVKQGLVRSPVDYIVAVLVATGGRSVDTTPLWLLDGMGQRPLFPPNVSGWKHNSYWVNASAMSQRAQAARQMAWRRSSSYWDGGAIHLAAGDITRSQVEGEYRDDPDGLVDLVASRMQLTSSASTTSALRTFSRASNWWERDSLVFLTLLAPEFHLA